MAMLKMCSCGAMIEMSINQCDACTSKRKETYKLYDKYIRDKDIAKFYSSKAWQLIRRKVLARDGGICLECLKDERLTFASECDHILPIRYYWHLRLNLDNLQSLCSVCHRTKTAEDKRRYEGRNALIPEWLKPSAIPLTIVCGPSGSGKTTYVKRHAAPNDIIIDLDDIMSKLSGKPWYEAGEEWVRPSIERRNELLSSLSFEKDRAAWYIVTAPKAEDRRKWAELLQPKSVIVLEIPESECLERLKKDTRRSGQWKRYYLLSKKWWNVYTRNSGETIIK